MVTNLCMWAILTWQFYRRGTSHAWLQFFECIGGAILTKMATWTTGNSSYMSTIFECTLIFPVHSKSKGRSLAVSIVSRNLETCLKMFLLSLSDSSIQPRTREREREREGTGSRAKPWRCELNERCTLIFLVHSKSKGRSLAVSIVSRNLETCWRVILFSLSDS